jgi:hypothetical protein
MPIFYFNFRSRDLLIEDDEGQDLPGLAEAHAAALVSAREILADEIESGTTDPLLAVVITNENGQELLTIPAKQVLPESLNRP